MEFEGLGANVVDEVAEMELGLAERLVRRFANQSAGQGEDVSGAGLGDGVSEDLCLGFLFGGKRIHRNPLRLARWIFRPKGSFHLCVQRFY